MSHLGTVKPGSTIYLPWHTFDSNDPSASVTMTGLALADIQVYKDGGTTQRASTAGFTLLDTDGTDFDTTTGIHGISIDLSNDTTADFWKAGSRYMVAIASVTVDAATLNFWTAEFDIGYPGAVLDTYLSAVGSQTSVTLNVGPAEADALNGCPFVIHDEASAVQLAMGYISDYAATTKVATLAAAPGFTIAAGDNISVFPPTPFVSTLSGHTAQTGDSYARLGAPAGASVSADIAVIEGQTDDIGVAGAGLTDLGGMSTAMKAEVNAEADTALTDYDPPTRTEATADKDAIIAQGDAAWTTGAGGTPPDLLQSTTIATLATQVSFTLTAGSADDDAYNGCLAIVTDQATATQKAVGVISDYTGATKTITLEEDPGVFTMAATDLIDIVATKAADQVWNALLTGSSYNIATSAGRRLRTLQDFGVYEGGAVWIDTVNGTAGTTDFENGTVTNPVDSIADALTIAASVNLRVFHVLPGSTITLAATVDDYEFIGYDWTLALGGQSASKTLFRGAAVSGIFSGNPRFEFCTINTITGPGGDMHACGYASTITVNGAGDWFIHHSFSKVAGTGTPVFDFGAAVANTNLNMRHWSGGIELQNCGGAGTDNASIEGNGQIVFNANCSGGTVAIRGHFGITDNASGAVTQSDRVNFETILDDGTTTYDRTTDSLQEIRDATTGLNDPTAAAVATAVMASVVETGYDVTEILRLCASALAGKLSGAGTASNVIRDINDTKARITATVDASGNRTAITLDET